MIRQLHAFVKDAQASKNDRPRRLNRVGIDRETIGPAQHRSIIIDGTQIINQHRTRRTRCIQPRDPRREKGLVPFAGVVCRTLDRLKNPPLLSKQHAGIVDGSTACDLRHRLDRQRPLNRLGQRHREDGAALATMAAPRPTQVRIPIVRLERVAAPIEELINGPQFGEIRSNIMQGNRKSCDVYVQDVCISHHEIVGHARLPATIQLSLTTMVSKAMSP